MFYLTALYHQLVLDCNKHHLQKNINIEPTMRGLRKRRIMSKNDLDVILKQTTENDKITELIKLLEQASEQTYAGFIELLKETDQAEIADLLGIFTSILLVYILYIHHQLIGISTCYSMFSDYWLIKSERVIKGKAPTGLPGFENIKVLTPKSLKNIYIQKQKQRKLNETQSINK